MSHKDDFKNKNGISVSTANYRLMRMLIFKMAKELNKHFCYRCGKETTLDSFSVEHKVPWAWEDNSLELYMDYGNIAISHNKCNSGHVRQTKRKREAPAKRKTFKNGKWKCSKCDRWKDGDKFHNNKKTIRGKESLCKPCRKEYRK